MGTVVLITLLLITRFHVSKMDADSEERRRDRISRREKRWSMNSQRLEQIVAELMRPIGDLRRSFDTDLSALLEEYLTEAGLHALEAGGASPGSAGSAGSGAGGAGAGAPNFPELALLLQQSANIYGRKVDFLYQHVLEVSESLQNSTNELSQSAAEGGSPATPGGTARRRRRASAGAGGAAGWARIELAAGAAGARREAPLRPPPTLPRMYVELEPRVLGAGDAPLADYAGEPVGLLQDFHVTWRLQGGLLVDELELGAEASPAPLRAIPLSELQAAIAAAAPPDPPPDPDPDPFDDDRLVASTPLPSPPAEEPPPLPPPAETPAPEEARALRRKRKPDSDLYEDGAGKMFVTAELLALVRAPCEFSVPAAWVARVVAARRAQLLAARRRLKLQPPLEEFRGFDELDKFDLIDIGGFLGWGETAGALAAERLSRLARLAGGDSDDDGFFEASDHGSDLERHDPKLKPPPPPLAPPPPPLPAVDTSPPEWMSWRSGVVARAAAGEARGLDVRALGRAVLQALPDSPAAPAPPATPFADVLAAAATDDADVSRLFLATLFLANAGNVEVVAGPPLSVDGFSLRVASRDERLYCAAADADPAFLDR